MALGSKSSTNGHAAVGNHSPGSDAATGISRAVVLILTTPARLINWLTTPPGNAIMIGLGVLYFGSVSAEGYWQAMNPNNPCLCPQTLCERRSRLKVHLHRPYRSLVLDGCGREPNCSGHSGFRTA
jgi:hypothetical protein